VRSIEDLPTTSDKPRDSVMIAASGVMSEEDLAKEEEDRKAAHAGSGAEDIWEVGFTLMIKEASDRDGRTSRRMRRASTWMFRRKRWASLPSWKTSVRSKQSFPLRIPADEYDSDFKSGNMAVALDKYQKALRYLDQHPALPEDAPAELVESFRIM